MRNTTGGREQLATSASVDQGKKVPLSVNGRVNSTRNTKLHMYIVADTFVASRIFLRLVLNACLQPSSILAIALARWSICMLQTSSFEKESSEILSMDLKLQILV